MRYAVVIGEYDFDFTISSRDLVKAAKLYKEWKKEGAAGIMLIDDRTGEIIGYIDMSK